MSDQPTVEQLKEQLIQDLEGFKARSAGIDNLYPTIKQTPGGHIFSKETPEQKIERASIHAMRYFSWHLLFEDTQKRAAPFLSPKKAEGLEEQLKELRGLRDFARRRKLEASQSLGRIDGLKDIGDAQMLKLLQGSKVVDSEPYYYSLAWAFVLETLDEKKD